ncbi:MAG: mycofactocin system glycosyltransferase [Actinomycetota bacterium]
MAGLTRFRRDPSWRQPGDGRVVLAGSPLRLFRVSAGGREVLDRAERGEQPDTEPVRRMLERFIDAGALHPQYPASPFGPGDVTVVVPAYRRLPTAWPTVGTVVVDDASPEPLSPPTDTPALVRVIRLDINGGPAAARNAGLAEVSTPLVAFLDTDVSVPPDWLDALLPHFSDPKVALVAPRVAAAPGSGAIAHHERSHSPLDLGTEPARIAAGSRVSYVPAAALVCRTAAVRDAGGFDTSMRVGEDVDLVWRLIEAGHRCRYEPASVVQHEPRHSWGAFVQQRIGYGRSAAPLAARHPGNLAPVRCSAWSAAVWALVAARRPLAGLLLGAATAAALVRRLRDLPPAEAARLVALGHLAAGRQFAAALSRVWWPVALPVALLVRRTRLPLLAALLVPTAVEAARSRSAQPVLGFPTRLLDEGSYALGVWQGVLQERRIEPLLPRFTTWPLRGDG